MLHLDTFTLVFLLFWFLIFFIVCGPLLVWLTGQDDRSTPLNSPRHQVLTSKTSVTQLSTDNKILESQQQVRMYKKQKVASIFKYSVKLLSSFPLVMFCYAFFHIFICDKIGPFLSKMIPKEKKYTLFFLQKMKLKMS